MFLIRLVQSGVTRLPALSLGVSISSGENCQKTPKHMVNQLIGSFFGGREVWQGNEMYSFRKLVDNGEYDCVTLGWRQTHDEV